MGPKWWKKIALYLSVNVFSRKVLIGDTIFTSGLVETGPPFYVVIRATQRFTRLQGKGSTFISQIFYDPEYCSGPGMSNPRPPALLSSVLLTELILPLLKWCRGILKHFTFFSFFSFFYYTMSTLCGNFKRQVEVLLSTGIVFHFSPFVSVTNPCRIC